MQQVAWMVLNTTVFKNDSCSLCVAALQVAKFLSLAAPDQGPAFFIYLCTEFKISSTCNTTYSSTTLGPVLTQVLANADVSGYDGRVRLAPEFLCPMFFDLYAIIRLFL
jgi:hypothetical protein